MKVGNAVLARPSAWCALRQDPAIATVLSGLFVPLPICAIGAP
jgi:hypothetical protein